MTRIVEGALSQVPVWCFHGANDRVVPPAGSTRMVNACKQSSRILSSPPTLRRNTTPRYYTTLRYATLRYATLRYTGTPLVHAGVDVKYTLYAHSPAPPGYATYTGHASWMQAYAEEALWEWLLSHRSRVQSGFEPGPSSD
eukprot:9308675-Pyramimonas_sp.AAC.1